jgi:hypothetical protein
MLSELSKVFHMSLHILCSYLIGNTETVLCSAEYSKYIRWNSVGILATEVIAYARYI